MKAPLTREDLLAVQDRARASDDARTLLWEIFRLRALTLRTHDYLRHTPTSSSAQLLADRLRSDLKNEPVIQEQPKLD